MLPYKTYSTISLGLFDIQVWGLMSAIGLIIGAVYAAKKGKQKGFDENTIYDLVFYSVLAGFVGSRLSYIFEHWSFYSLNLLDTLKIWQGGLSFGPGFVFAAIAGYIYIKKHKLDFLKYADVLAPAIPLGHIFGRLACYLIGDHLGTPSNLPWAIFQDGALRHPVILYEIIYLIIIFLIVRKISKMNVVKGTAFASYLILYSIARFINDFFRVDPAYFGFTGTQYLMVLIFFGTIIWYSKVNKKW
ncbi:MAG: prolipoprotein diacylglyceryl transferase [Candidatus Woesearchaeota archaeon]